MKLRDMKQIRLYVLLIFALGSAGAIHAMESVAGAKTTLTPPAPKTGGWFSWGGSSVSDDDVSDKEAWDQYIKEGEAAAQKTSKAEGGLASWLAPKTFGGLNETLGLVNELVPELRAGVQEIRGGVRALLPEIQQTVTHVKDALPEIREGVKEIRGTVSAIKDPLVAAIKQATTTMAGLDKRLTDIEKYIENTPAAQEAKKAFEAGKFAEHSVKPVMTQINHGVQETLDASFDNAKKKANTFWDTYVTQKNLMIGGAVLGGAVVCYGLYKLGSYWIYSYLNKPTFNYTHIKASEEREDQDDQSLSMQDMVFCTEVKDRFNTVLITAASIKEQIIKGDDLVTYRNLALYGPPGSGKRLFARQLADHTKMDFYELPGSSLTKYKDGDAAAAVENFFKTVNNSNPRGAVVYINNANLLFSDQKSRTVEGAATINSLVSAFVEHLEKRSSTCMVILASSLKPESMGDIARGIDDIIEIKRPELEERIKGLILYRNKFLLGGEEVAVKFADSVLTYFDDSKIGEIAGRLQGATIGDIHDFVKSVRDEVRLEGFVSSELLDRVTARTVEKYKALIQ